MVAWVHEGSPTLEKALCLHSFATFTTIAKPDLRMLGPGRSATASVGTLTRQLGAERTRLLSVASGNAQVCGVSIEETEKRFSRRDGGIDLNVKPVYE
jgi:hypothetical protein